MALTLAQAAVLSQSQLQRGVVETFAMESPILERIPQMEIEGNSYAYNMEAALPGVEFRAVNQAYAESTGTFNQASERLVILGGDADVDTFIQQTRSDINDQRAIQTRMKVKAAVYAYQDAFINGNSAFDANTFDGLQKRLTGAQVIDAGPDGIPVIGDSDNDRWAFFDKLDELIAAVGAPGPDIILGNRQIIAKLNSSARRLTVYSEGRDTFGRVIAQYAGIPVIDIGTKADGTPIIHLDETIGASEPTTSSLYAVKFGQGEADGGVTGLTNGGVQVKDLGEIDAKPVLRTRIEFFCGLGVFSGKAAARLRGVING